MSDSNLQNANPNPNPGPDSGPEPFLRASGLRKSHPGGDAGPQVVLDGASLEVRPGETVAILGASGSGKTTLLHLLGGLDSPDAGTDGPTGRVGVAGRDWSEMTPDAAAVWRNRHLGFVFQFHLLLPEFSALENAAMPLILRRVSRAAAKARAGEILADLGLAAHSHKTPGQLSGGERQRTAVARALAGEPGCILADEPTGNLDRRNADGVFAALRDACEKRGAALVVATHDERLAAKLSRRMILSDGKLREET